MVRRGSQVLDHRRPAGIGGSMKHLDQGIRTAVVTGAASGIGKGIAVRLLHEGWKVVAVDRDREALEQMEKHDRLMTVAADVSRETDIKKVLARVARKHGRLDAIISNAGISEFKSLAESTLADWNRVVAINLTAAFLLAKHGEGLLRESGGSMVVISSTRAHMSEPDTHAYSASKGGLLALAHSLAVSMGPLVRVNCISPGWIDVDGGKLTAGDHKQHPAGRVGQPQDVAAAVAYLLSPDAAFITGAELIVDGGMSRKMMYQ